MCRFCVADTGPVDASESQDIHEIQHLSHSFGPRKRQKAEGEQQGQQLAATVPLIFHPRSSSFSSSSFSSSSNPSGKDFPEFIESKEAISALSTISSSSHLPPLPVVSLSPPLSSSSSYSHKNHESISTQLMADAVSPHAISSSSPPRKADHFANQIEKASLKQQALALAQEASFLRMAIGRQESKLYKLSSQQHTLQTAVFQAEQHLSADAAMLQSLQCQLSDCTLSSSLPMFLFAVDPFVYADGSILMRPRILEVASAWKSLFGYDQSNDDTNVGESSIRQKHRLLPPPPPLPLGEGSDAEFLHRHSLKRRTGMTSQLNDMFAQISLGEMKPGCFMMGVNLYQDLSGNAFSAAVAVGLTYGDSSSSPASSSDAKTQTPRLKPIRGYGMYIPQS